MNSTLEITPLSPAAGAQVSGVDPRQPLGAAAVETIQKALGEHGLLLFKDAKMSNDEHVKFSAQFGPLEKHTLSDVFGVKGQPEILVLSNVKENGKYKGAVHAGQYWHSDVSYTERPSTGSLLLCYEKPDIGGDTMFANMYLAYETLSDTMKGLLRGLKGVHDYNHAFDTFFSTVKDRPPLTAEQRARVPPVEHPLLRTHPVTGRTALYVNPGFTCGIVGMTRAESKPILDFLFQHSTRPEFVYRHRWSLHDLLFWDNRCVMHYAVNDYDDSVRRHMHRTTIAGDKPYLAAS